MRDYVELSRSVAGRKAIVTGAASGMGRATAHLLAREGAHVAVTDLDQTACDKIVGEIEAAGFSTARAYAMDMSDNAAIAATAKTIIDDLGGLDIVVNNAGMALPSPIDGDDYPAHWEKSLAVMLEGPQVLIRESLAALRASDSARIVNIASTEGLGGSAGNSPYTAAKHGIIGLTKGWRLNWANRALPSMPFAPAPFTPALPKPFPTRIRPLSRIGAPRSGAMASLKKWRISPCLYVCRRPAM